MNERQLIATKNFRLLECTEILERHIVLEVRSGMMTRDDLCTLIDNRYITLSSTPISILSAGKVRTRYLFAENYIELYMYKINDFQKILLSQCRTQQIENRKRKCVACRCFIETDDDMYGAILLLASLRG